MPAVKNSTWLVALSSSPWSSSSSCAVVAGALNFNPHRLSIAITLPRTSVNCPKNAPVPASNALIVPSPKFPTNNAPANFPNPPGASATPHGEFNVPCAATCCTTFPFASNTSTNPFPGPATSSCLSASCTAIVTNNFPFTFSIPNGASPAGRLLSVNELTSVRFVSYFSTNPLRKLVTNRNTFDELSVARAIPLYTALDPELSTRRIECVGSTFGFQPDTVPSSVDQMNIGEPEFVPSVIVNAPVSLPIIPVGAAGFVLPAGGAIVTTNDCTVPEALYNVDTPVPLSDTHTRPPDGAKAIPHGFTRFGSVNRATPAISDTRFTC